MSDRYAVADDGQVVLVETPGARVTAQSVGELIWCDVELTREEARAILLALLALEARDE